MRVSGLGEFGLISRLREAVGQPGEGEVWVGDDTAVLRAPAGTILFTCDAMVEGVHFDLQLTGAKDLGYKAIAVNVSDVAAMGGTPRRAVVAIGISPNSEVAWIDELYAGMRECSDEFGMAVVGGDVCRSACLFISVALIGNPAGRRFIERGGARVGDAVCITGTPGASAAGYRLLRAGSDDHPGLVKAHLRPTPRVREVEVLRRHFPTAMIDVSDGLVADLSRVCEASEVGALLVGERIPVVDLAGADLGKSPMDLALYGGEDYELCFTLPADRAEAAAADVLDATGTKVTVIGSVVDPPASVAIEEKGVVRPLEPRGWDHLAL